MDDKINANIKRYEDYHDNLLKKHPDTFYSLDPAEREEEMNKEPVLDVEDLEVYVKRPLPENAGPDYVALRKECVKFLHETIIPMEEFLDKLDRGEADPNDFPLIFESAGEDNTDSMEIPSLIENKCDYDPI